MDEGKVEVIRSKHQNCFNMPQYTINTEKDATPQVMVWRYFLYNGGWAIYRIQCILNQLKYFEIMVYVSVYRGRNAAKMKGHK